VIGRKHRFHGRGSLSRHYQTSKSVRTSTMALRFLRNERRSNYRVAVVVSRKVSKSAVVRNRIRRRLYENVRILCGSLASTYDLVFIVYDEKLANILPADLAQEVAKLCEKAGLDTSAAPEHAMMEPKE
jgi:ribonuclease P protein component